MGAQRASVVLCNFKVILNSATACAVWDLRGNPSSSQKYFHRLLVLTTLWTREVWQVQRGFCASAKAEVGIVIPARRSGIRQGYLGKYFCFFSSFQINNEGYTTLEAVTMLTGSTVTFLKQHHNIKKKKTSQNKTKQKTTKTPNTFQCKPYFGDFFILIKNCKVLMSQVRLWLLQILCHCVVGNLKTLLQSNIWDTEASYENSYQRTSLIFPFVPRTTASNLP